MMLNKILTVFFFRVEENCLERQLMIVWRKLVVKEMKPMLNGSYYNSFSLLLNNIYSHLSTTTHVELNWLKN
jgi:hypothetical protein